MLVVAYLIVMVLLAAYALAPELPSRRRGHGSLNPSPPPPADRASVDGSPAVVEPPVDVEPRPADEPPRPVEPSRAVEPSVAQPPAGAEPPTIADRVRATGEQQWIAFPAAPDKSDDELVEVMLAAKLLAGQLPAIRYQRAMALLAAHDAVRHPLVVPPERSA